MPLATPGGLFIVLDDGAEAIMLRKSRLAAPDDVVTKTDLPGAIDAILANVQARISTWAALSLQGGTNAAAIQAFRPVVAQASSEVEALHRRVITEKTDRSTLQPSDRGIPSGRRPESVPQCPTGSTAALRRKAFDMADDDDSLKAGLQSLLGTLEGANSRLAEGGRLIVVSLMRSQEANSKKREEILEDIASGSRVRGTFRPRRPL